MYTRMGERERDASGRRNGSAERRTETKRERVLLSFREEIQFEELRVERGQAGFLVYRGINPCPQLPFVLGAAWSTC